MTIKNKKYYANLISKAANISNKNKKYLGYEVNFYDHLDWGAVGGEGLWTDVFMRIGKRSEFAFTIQASFPISNLDWAENILGTVPEAIRSYETGLWSLTKHGEKISHEDVGIACKKWIALNSPLKRVCLGCNVYFNDTYYGHQFTYSAYPREIRR